MKAMRPYMFFVIVMIVFIMFFYMNQEEDEFIIEQPTSMSNDWSHDNEMISLPADLVIEENERFTITTTLDENFSTPQHILFRSSLQEISITLDGEVIYERTYGTSLTRPFVSMWHIVSLPGHSDGSILTVTLSSPYGNIGGTVNDISYGTEAMIYASLIRAYGLRFILISLIFIIGFIMMIFDSPLFKHEKRGFVYLGLFAVLLSLWMFAESKMIQFFTGSQLLIGTLAYLVLPLFPQPMITYLNKYIIKHYKWPLIALRVIYIIQFLIVSLFYLFGIASFFETLIPTQIAIGVGIIVILTVLILETFKYHNKTSSTFLKSFVVLAIFGIAELINFMLGYYRNTSLYLSIGMVFLMIALFINYAKYNIQQIKNSKEKELYEKLAFIDHVTQGKNRLSFEQDLDLIFNNKQNLTFRLILFDLDSLKHINDTYGHVEGDQAIKHAFKIISETFEDKGTCYRIGGDEFACIYLDNDEAVYLDKSKSVFDKAQVLNKDLPYHFGLSYGSAVSKPLDMNTKDFLRLADKDMYQHKKRNKNRIK